VQNTCIFLNEEERKLVDFLKDSPKLYSEIVKYFVNKGIVKDRRTVNKLLKESETKRLVYRVDVNGEVFYRLNTFPFKINFLIGLADETKNVHLLEIKKEILKHYPNVSFEQMIENYTKYLELTEPKNKGLIQLLKTLKDSDITPLRFE